MEPLSCVLRVGERQSVGLHYGGRRRQRKEKVACGGMAVYRVLEKYFAFMFLFLVLEKFFFNIYYYLYKYC